MFFTLVSFILPQTAKTLRIYLSPLTKRFATGGAPASKTPPSRVRSDFLASARREEKVVTSALHRRRATTRGEEIARTQRDTVNSSDSLVAPPRSITVDTPSVVASRTRWNWLVSRREEFSKRALTLAFMLELIPAGAIPALTLPSPGIETLISASALEETLFAPAKKEKMAAVITAYSSTPDQTDDTPFITASGYHVTDGVVAANFLPMHTRIQIPQLFGNKIFVVKDRMHKRFNDRVDIWFPDRASAKKFGLRRAEIIVL